MIKNLEEFKQILTSTTLLSNSYSKEWKNDAVIIIEFMSKAFEIEDETDTIINVILNEISNLSLVQEYNAIKSNRDYNTEYTEEDILYDIKGKIIAYIDKIGEELNKYDFSLSEEFDYKNYSTYQAHNRFLVTLRASRLGIVLLTRQIAIMYALGIGCEKDLYFAKLRLKQAAFWGDITSMKILSYIYSLENNKEKAKLYANLYELSNTYLNDGVTVLPDDDKKNYSEEERLYFTYISSINQDIIINGNVPNINFSFLEAIFSNKSYNVKMNYINNFHRGEWKEATNASCEPKEKFGFIK